MTKKMVFVQGGNNHYDDEQPVHSVTLSDSYIGKYEMTQERWKEVVVLNLFPQFRILFERSSLPSVHEKC